MLDRLQLAGIDPNQLDQKKLDRFLSKNFKDKEVEISNNVKDEYYESTLLDTVEFVYYSKTKPIITAFNTLFHNHHRVENIPTAFLDNLKTKRDAYKHEMYQYINDMENQHLFRDRNGRQLIMKLIANSYYGAFGMSAFHFFNKLMGPSVTAQGRQLISASILGFEAFLNANYTFETFDDLTNFLNNIFKEECDDEIVLEVDYQINAGLIIKKYLSKCKFTLKDSHRDYLEMVIHDELPETLLQKLYFKNNLFAFFEVPLISEIIRDELIVEGFYNANKPPKEIEESLYGISDYIRYFVGYPYPYPLKTKTASTMERDVVLVCDTDSNFLYVYKWLELVTNLLGEDIEEIEDKRRASIVSVLTFFVTQFVDEIFKILCTNSNVPPEHHYRINMKSEFHYKRVILTKNKKSYAGLILSKEGSLLEKPKFDIKGIPIKKTTTPRPARLFFGHMLEERMLKSPTINIKEIYQEYHGFSKHINQDLREGNTYYLKTGVFKNLKVYKKPYTLQAARAWLTWNALFINEYMGEYSSFKILELNDKIPPVMIPSGKKDAEGKPILKFNDEFPEFVRKEFGEDVEANLMKLYDEHPGLKKYGFTHIAIPMHIDRIPEKFIKYARFNDITNSIVKKGNILLESLGFVLIESKNTAVMSNIIKI